MTCLIIAGILFIQTPENLISVDDLIEATTTKSGIQLSLGQDGGWLMIEGKSLDDLVACLQSAEVGP